MPRVEPVQHSQFTRRQINGRFGDQTGGGSDVTVFGDSGQIVTNALLVFADLIDTSGVAVDGTATDVDNVTLGGGEIVLRAANIGAGGDVDNGLWRATADGVAWSRYREDLHVDGLVVVVKRGDADVAGATSPNVPYRGLRETMWTLITDNPFELGTDAVEFRQMTTLDSLKLTYDAPVTPGFTPIVVPPGGAVSVPLDTVDIAGLYHDTTSLPSTTHEYSGVFYVDLSLLVDIPSTPVLLGADVYVAGAQVQNLITKTIGSTERVHGGVNIRVAGDDLDTIQFRFTDPGGAGYTINLISAYADINLRERR